MSLFLLLIFIFCLLGLWERYESLLFWFRLSGVRVKTFKLSLIVVIRLLFDKNGEGIKSWTFNPRFNYTEQVGFVTYSRLEISVSWGKSLQLEYLSLRIWKKTENTLMMCRVDCGSGPRNEGWLILTIKLLSQALNNMSFSPPFGFIVFWINEKLDLYLLFSFSGT